MRKLATRFIFARPYNGHIDPDQTTYFSTGLGIIDEYYTYEEIINLLIREGDLPSLYDPRLRYNLVIEVFEESMRGDQKEYYKYRPDGTKYVAGISLRSISKAVPLREGQTLASTHLTDLVRVQNILYFACSIEIRDLPPPAKEPSSAPGWDKIINALLTSLAANAVNFTASIVTITTALVAVEKLWSKKHRVDIQSSPEHSAEAEIVAIRLLMTDGTQHRFEEWLTDPAKLKHYVDVFNQPSSPVKPLQAIFVLKKDGPVVVDVTEGVQNNLQLKEMLNYLHIEPEQQ